MAKKISDEILSLKVVVNGNEAQKRILDLEKANNLLSERMNEQKNIMRSLSKRRKKDSEEYRKAEKELEALTKQYTENKKAIDAEVKAMDIMSLTMQQLHSRARDLQFTLSHMAPGTREYRAAQEELSRLNNRMGELRAGTRAAGSSLGNLADKFNRYSGVVAASIATLAGVAVSIQSTIDLNNKLADAQTAVAKTTGLTDDAVKELTKSFSEFDTRTSKIDLLKIAEVGGRLGVPKEEIKDFTREVDKAYVALGDSFSGGVEEVANKIGKIKGLFRETKDLDMATAINQIGSSMNELGAAGAASEANIAEFATRVGALPDKLKPTVAEALALGAAFEESGIDAERSATAYSNFVRRAAQDTQGFAEVMNLPVAKIKELINSDPTEFFLKFSQGLKGLDATDIAAILEKLKLNDQYLTSIVSVAGDNINKFRKSIETSNQALEEATSLQEEFNKVNNNAAAIYDKVRKKFIGMFTSEAVVNTLTWLIETFGKFIGAVEDSSGVVTGFRNTLIYLLKIIAVITTATVLYNASIGTYNALLLAARNRVAGLLIVEKARNVVNSIAKALQLAWNAVTGVAIWLTAQFTNNLKLQIIAQERLNAVTRAHPFGIILTVISLLITAYISYKTVVGEAEKAQKNLNDITKEGVKNAATEVSELDKLYKAATNVKLSIEERTKAAKKLQETYPNTFKNISTEIIMNGKAEKSYYALRNAIIETARAKAAEVELQKRAAEDLAKDEEWRQQYMKEVIENQKLKKNKGKKYTKRVDGGDGKMMTIELDYDDLIASSNERLKILEKERYDRKLSFAKNNKWLADKSSYQSDLLGNDVEDFKSPYNIPTNDDKKTKSKKKTEAERKAERELKQYENLKKRILESAEKFAEQEEQLEIRKQENLTELRSEGYIKEFNQIQVEFRKKKAELEKQKVSKNALAQIDEIIKREKDGEKKKFEAIRDEWLSQNKKLEQLQKQEEQISALKIEALKEKYEAIRLRKLEENFNREIFLLKTKENEKIAELKTVAEQKAFLQDKISDKELSKIHNWENGKQAIQKHFQKENLKLQTDYLKQLVKQLEQLPPADLTDEQTKALEGMRAKLAEIGVELATIKNGEEKDKFSSLSSFGGQADLFGLTPEQWEAMFENTDQLEIKIQKIGAAMQVAKNIMSTYFSYMQANQEAELRRYEVASDRKKRKLQAQLDAGIISQEEYKHKTIAIENELSIKKWQLEVDAARRDKAMKIADTISNTAMAIMSLWSTQAKNPILAGILTGVVSALGAMQVATIAKQPLPAPPSAVGAEDGYYPVRRLQDGKLFRARKKESRSGIYDEPTMLVGEQGKNFPELVVSGKAMKRIDPKIQRDFMQEVYRAEGFEKGKYPAPEETSRDYTNEIISLLSRTTQVLERIEQYGVRGVFEKSARTGKDIEEMRKDYKRLVEKNKH